MKPLILLIVLATWLPEAALANASHAERLVGSCDYYDVKSFELGCGVDGYLVQFGSRYCRKFEASRDRYSPLAQVVLSRIKVCLQRELENAPNLNCLNVKAVAIDSHVGCYLESGFCNVGWKDRIRIGKTVFGSLFDPEIQEAGRRIRNGCN